MKRREEEVDQSVERHLKLFSAPPVQAIDDAKERTRRRLSMQPVGEANEAPELVVRRSAWRWRLGLAGAAAVVALAVVFMPRGIDARAVVEAADGGLSEDSGRVLRAGEKIEAGSVVRANGSGAMLKLADGSHVEMRGNSKLSLERADDGVRVQLSDGDVIVNAAKQHGHLYVQTKDVNVSVVGTVFLVKSEETGSRVAVIEGEVRVQQGATEKNLRPGEQVNTNPLVTLQPVSQEIAWSSRAPEHIALLQQSAAVPTVSQDAFEEASIRTSAVPPAGGRGGAPTGGGSSLSGCPMLAIEVDPARFSATRITLWGLIALAYGNRCPSGEVFSGGPDWIKSQQYDVQALIPAGASPTYTRADLLDGNAPKLQKMLQALLANRFNLILRQEIKELSVYNLVVVKAEKLTPSGNDPAATAARFSAVRQRSPMMGAGPVSIAEYAGILQGQMGRPVIDKTNIKGLYDFLIVFSDQAVPPPPSSPGSEALAQSLRTMRDVLPSKLEEQLGLKLEPAKAPVEVWVIDRVERPSEN